MPKPFLDAPGCTGRGLKGGSTVLQRSREQRRGTFTPNKRDPSEFITVPIAGAQHKATEPSHLKRRGFHKESRRVLPSPASSRAQHKAQRGPGHEPCPRAALVARPEPFKSGQTPLPGGPAAGDPYRAGRPWKCSFWRANSRHSASPGPQARPPPRGKRPRNRPAEP